MENIAGTDMEAISPSTGAVPILFSFTCSICPLLHPAFAGNIPEPCSETEISGTRSFIRAEQIPLEIPKGLQGENGRQQKIFLPPGLSNLRQGLLSMNLFYNKFMDFTTILPLFFPFRHFKFALLPIPCML